MIFMERIKVLGKLFNDENDYHQVRNWLNNNPIETSFARYLSQEFNKIENEKAKFELLTYAVRNFPERDDFQSVIVKKMNLNTDDKTVFSIGVMDEGNQHGFVYDQNQMPITLLSHLLWKAIYAVHYVKETHEITEIVPFQNIVINELIKQNIKPFDRPVPPYEDAVYMSEGVFTNTGKEDPEIIPSEPFLRFKQRYDEALNLTASTSQKMKMK